MMNQIKVISRWLAGFFLTSFLITSFLITSSASAQDISQLEMLRCTSFESPNEKLACFESLITEIPMISAEDEEEEEEDEDLSKKGSWGERFGLGILKKKAKKIEPEETYYATVTKVVEGNYRVLYFYTEKGHVWRQIEARSFWYPRKQSFKIEINQGRMGEYQLKVDGQGNFTSVRRLK